MTSELSVMYCHQLFCLGQSNPLGFSIQVVLAKDGIISVDLATPVHRLLSCQSSVLLPPPPLVTTICSQLFEYCVGTRHSFTLPLAISNLSPFSQRVYHVVSAIPYGHTMTYGEVAAMIGVPRASQAVGRALAHNPVPILIPCHRVVGRAGWIGGYSCGDGIKTKTVLLEHEMKVVS